MIRQAATETKEVVVNSTIDVRGDALVVNVKKRDKTSMFIPTMKIPLDRVLGAETDPQIQRKMWRAWVVRSFTPGAYITPNSEVRFYNPHHFSAHKAIIVLLKDESYERLVVEVEDPDGAVEQINQAVGASSQQLNLA